MSKQLGLIVAASKRYYKVLIYVDNVLHYTIDIKVHSAVHLEVLSCVNWSVYSNIVMEIEKRNELHRKSSRVRQKSA
jgi:hypothetical protein